MLDLDNLGGHISEVLLERREITDPWGFGIKAEVLRSDHPDWRQAELERAANKPGAAKIRRVTAETAFADFAPGGFRKAKKLGKAESHRKMVNQLSEPGEVQIDLLALREMKPAIASIIISRMSFRGETRVRRRGTEYDLDTPEGREAFFDHQAWQIQDGGETKDEAIPVYKLDAAGKQVLEVGEPVEQEYGGQNIGDAIPQWCLDEAGDLAEFVEQRRAAALEPSAGGSTGSTATGSLVQPSVDEP